MSFFDRYTKIEFRLIDTDGVVLDNAGDSIEVEEPKDYEATKFVLERITNQENVPRHGFNFAYGDPESPIVFIKAAGYQLVQDVFDIKGNDAIMQYQFLATDVRDNSTKADIRYYIDFNSYKREWVNGEPRVTLTLINESLAYKIRSRYETSVDLLASEDKDGNAITPLTMNSHYWHSKVIKLVASLKGDNTLSGNGRDIVSIGGVDIRENEAFVIKLPHIRELNEFEIFNYEGTPVFEADNTYEGFFMFNAPEDGVYTFDYYLPAYFIVDFTNKSVTINDPGIWELYYQIGDDPNDAVLLHSTSGKPPFSSTTNRFQWGHKDPNGGQYDQFNEFDNIFNLQLKRDDNVYFFYRYLSTEVDGVGSARRRNFEGATEVSAGYINVTAFTEPVATEVKSLDIYDFIQRTFEIISGQTDIVKSDFYEIGCGSQRWLTNGYQIRQFESDERPPETTPEDLIDAITMIDAVGWGYEKINNEVKVRIEDSDYFYKDAEILKIDNPISYKEEIADELIINQLIFEFKDYIDEEINTLDSFTTKGDFLTPISTKILQLELFCEYIADAYSIEYTRRQQFNDSPTDAWRYDNSIFIIDWVEITKLDANSGLNTLVYGDSATVGADSTITLPIIIPELIDLTDFSFDNLSGLQSFTVDTVTFNEDLNQTIITVNESTTAQAGTIEFILDNGFSFKRPESNQSFSTINNLISPDTTYNLRMSMKRLIMKHYKWINSGLNYKQNTDVIKTNFLDHNKNLQTQFRIGANCLGGDLNKILLEEKSDLTLSDYGNFARYFIPIKVMYEAELSFEENEKLRNALNGSSTNNDNYGYISILNEEGTYTKVYINQHIYRPLSGKVEGFGYKKYE